MHNAHAKVEKLLAAIDGHDPYTAGHSCRVASLALLLGRLMGMNGSKADLLQDAALMHDVGKIALPPTLLSKAARLSRVEFEMIQQHSALGASILDAVGGLDHLVPVVLHHHERWDGSGYPRGLSGENIPIESRVILVADAYDAMTTERPYGPVMTSHEAMDEIERCQGAQFDPLVAGAMRLAYDGGLIEHESDPDSIAARI